MQPPYIYVCFPGWANYINVFAVSLEDRKEKQPKISKYGLHIFMSRVFLPSKKKKSLSKHSYCVNCQENKSLK